jgi:hypothetical protein
MVLTHPEHECNTSQSRVAIKRTGRYLPTNTSRPLWQRRQPITLARGQWKGLRTIELAGVVMQPRAHTARSQPPQQASQEVGRVLNIRIAWGSSISDVLTHDHTASRDRFRSICIYTIHRYLLLAGRLMLRNMALVELGLQRCWLGMQLST